MLRLGRTVLVPAWSACHADRAGVAAAVETLIHDIIRESHLTCVIVTHDIAQAARMGTRVMTLEEGALQESARSEAAIALVRGPVQNEPH